MFGKPTFENPGPNSGLQPQGPRMCFMQEQLIFGTMLGRSGAWDFEVKLIKHQNPMLSHLQGKEE